MWDQPEVGVAAVTSYKITTVYPPGRPVKTVSRGGLWREVVLQQRCFMCGGIHYGEFEGLVSIER